MNLPDFLIDHPDGEIRVTGSRIGLYHLIADYKEGQTPQMLHDQFPHLPLDLIQRVLAFYHDNQAEVDAYVAQYQADLDRLYATTPRLTDWEALKRRMREMGRLRDE